MYIFHNQLNRIFRPQSVAVIGATENKGHVGEAIISNLVSSGYMGKIYPVNPGHGKIKDLRCYAKIGDIGEKIDLVIIAVPADLVPSVYSECGEKDAGGAVIISSGFKESGDEGERLYDMLKELRARYRTKIIGPNCLGFINPWFSLNASFAPHMPGKGKIAFISQSGALGTAVLDWARGENIGFSLFVSVGEMLDIGFADLIDYLGRDPNTGSILLYMESLSNARRFLSAARAFTKSKPIIVLKAGRTVEGALAAQSHTGSLAGDDLIFSAAFKRAGILKVDTIGQLFDSAETLAMDRFSPGKRLAIITNAGGPAVMATDCLIKNGGKLAKLTKETIDRLDFFLPKNWSKGNPVDVLGDADPGRYGQTLEICASDEGVDGILAILTIQSMTNAAGIAHKIIEVSRKIRKPIFASFMGGGSVAEADDLLKSHNIPVYRMPENAVVSFLNMHNYYKNLTMISATPSTIPHEFSPRTGKNREMLGKITDEGRYILTEPEAKEFLSNYDIFIPRGKSVNSLDEGIKAAAEIGYPVVAKVISPDILHKTELQAYRTHIKNEEELRLSFDNLMHSVQSKLPSARIMGMLVEEEIKGKYELFLGSKKDPIFGPVIVFGLGGTIVEVFNDINVAIPPLNMWLAEKLMEDTKIFQLLKGYRGIKGVDVRNINFLLYKFAYLLMDFPEIKTVDINPYLVGEGSGFALDAKIILDRELVGRDVKPFSHLVIAPYPREFTEDFTMKNGKSVTIRPIKPEDEPLEREMFSHFSEETQRFRFFSLLKDVSHSMLIRYTQIDYDREMAMIAELGEEGKKRMLGVSRVIADPYNQSAEFALVVADPWQNQGLGSKLTDYILQVSKIRGVKKVYAYLLEDNLIMRHMFEKRGFTVCPKEGNYYAEKWL